jgi:hypothetical protein
MSAYNKQSHLLSQEGTHGVYMMQLTYVKSDHQSIIVQVSLFFFFFFFFPFDISLSRPGLKYQIQMLPVIVSQAFFTSKETSHCAHTNWRVVSASHVHLPSKIYWCRTAQVANLCSMSDSHRVIGVQYKSELCGEKAL